MKSNVKQREAKFEALRFIAMFMIVASHYAIYTEFAGSDIFINRIFVDFISLGGRLGTNIFFLLTGYFMINSQKSQLSRVLRIVLQTATYSILAAILFTASGITAFNLQNIIKSCMPISSGLYWFMGCYCLIMLLLPFINKFVETLSQKDYLKLLLLLFIIWSVIGSVSIGTGAYGYNIQGWGIYMYLVGGYIRKNYSELIKHKKKVYISLIAAVAVYIAAVLCVELVNTCFQMDISVSFLGQEYFIVTIICSICMFLAVSFIKQMGGGISVCICRLSSSVIGIYLLHENGLYIRDWLWNTLICGYKYENSWLCIPYSLAAIIFVMAGSIVIDKVFGMTLFRAEQYLINQLMKKVSKKIPLE